MAPGGTLHETLGVLAMVLIGGTVGCSPAKYGHPRRYNQSMDSATQACRKNPAYCTAMAGEEAAVPLPSGAKAAATAGASAAGAMRVIDAAMEARIDKALAECADEARSSVLVAQMGGRSPTAEECMEAVRTESNGTKVTRAMWFGELMHRAALDCAQERLDAFLRGRFHLEPRYRRHPKTGQLEWLSSHETKALLREGKGAELKGSIAPDVVIHMGDPLRAQLVYDFKFPCVSTAEWNLWRVYPRGHPYQGRSQDAVYRELLGAVPRRVQPRLGVEP
jgi:hypothetical protein